MGAELGLTQATLALLAALAPLALGLLLVLPVLVLRGVDRPGT
ncbi:MAG: hypothetical protein R3F30_03435 [Planctomycetota bacterium]